MEHKDVITVINRQTGVTLELPGPKSVHDILLGLRLVEAGVLVMRSGELLTRDVRVMGGERIEIIPVISGG